jgi:hypothetical protein
VKLIKANTLLANCIHAPKGMAIQMQHCTIAELNDHGLADGNGKHGEGLCVCFVPDLQCTAATEARLKYKS